jgi:hypothetical protein
MHLGGGCLILELGCQAIETGCATATSVCCWHCLRKFMGIGIKTCKDESKGLATDHTGPVS